MHITRVRQSGGSIEMTVPRELVIQLHLQHGDVIAINLKKFRDACYVVGTQRQN